MRMAKSMTSGPKGYASRSGRAVGSGFSKPKGPKAARKVTMGKNRPAKGSTLRTSRPKRGAAGGRGY